MEQGRYELAENELRQALAERPQDGATHALFAICLSELNKFDEAIENGRVGVGLEPDDSLCHYALAVALFRRDQEMERNISLFASPGRYKEAESSLNEAIRLNSNEAHFFAMLASIRLARRDWTAALEVAEQGLRINPENVECGNCRATALVKLGRRKEADGALEAALSKDPENSHTHANKGWALLHEGNPKAALDHLKEALRIDPSNEYAQAGIVEALKARNIIYRWMLAYFLWMSRLSGGARWAVIIGGYVVIRLLGSWERSSPGIGPYVFPIILLYSLFAVMTWTAPQLFNLLLRLDKHGRCVLSSSQILGANCAGACLFGAVTLLIAGFWLNAELLILGALGCFAMLIPVGGTFNREGRARKALGLYSIGLAAVGLAALALAVPVPGLGSLLGDMFWIGIVLFSWGSNFLRN